MGTSTDAHCYACGYDKFLGIGSGMESMDTVLLWPVFCTKCNEISTANFKDVTLRCRECESENVTELDSEGDSLGDGHEIAVQWERKSLSNGHYRCPKCRSFNLRIGTNPFGRYMSWD